MDPRNSVVYVAAIGPLWKKGGEPSRTRNESGILNSDWFVTNGGDGFESAIDPFNPNVV